MIGWYIGRYAWHGTANTAAMFDANSPRFHTVFQLVIYCDASCFPCLASWTVRCPRYSGKEIRNHDETWRMIVEGRKKRRENRDEGEAHCRYIAGAVLSAHPLFKSRDLRVHHTMLCHTRVLINSSLYVCLIPAILPPDCTSFNLRDTSCQKARTINIVDLDIDLWESFL